MSLRGLTIVVATADETRSRSALTMACAHAALGAPASVFLDDAAVPLVTADAMLATALDLGVAVMLCQTGLDHAELSMATLDPRIAAGGIISVMAELGGSRLVVV